MSLLRRQENPRSSPFRESSNLWHELDELSARMSRLMSRPLTGGDKESLAAIDWTPSVNVSETEKAYTIQAELPEVDKKDVHVRIEDGVLTLEGTRERKHQEKEAKFHRVECAYGHFMRRFTMPDDVDEAGIKAAFRDGMLNVTIPRTPGKRVGAKEVAVS